MPAGIPNGGNWLSDESTIAGWRPRERSDKHDSRISSQEIDASSKPVIARSLMEKDIAVKMDDVICSRLFNADDPSKHWNAPMIAGGGK